METIKEHWEKVYKTKQPDEVSWTQVIPVTSLDLIRQCNLPKTARIIDIGGGDSKLVDHLVDEGYKNITVLDISATAIDRAKQRLGEHAQKVIWIVTDILEFKPTQEYDIWHDRAAFHFLTTDEHIEYYKTIVKQAAIRYLVIGTFSDTGPKKCSGLDIHNYNAEQLEKVFAPEFEKVNCIQQDHTTPFNTIQNFLFCLFKRVQ